MAERSCEARRTRGCLSSLKLDLSRVHSLCEWNGSPLPPADPSIDLSVLRGRYGEYFTRDARELIDERKSKEDDRRILERVAVGLTLGKNTLKLLNPTPYSEFTPAGGGPAKGLGFTRAGERIRVMLPEEAGTLVVKEQWFPGWEGRLGRNAVEVGKTVDGLMRVELKADDTGELTLHFSRTRWDRLAGIVLSAACLTGLLCPRWRRKEVDHMSVTRAD